MRALPLSCSTIRVHSGGVNRLRDEVHMTKTLRHAALAILVAVLVVGCSSSSEEAQQTTTSAADTSARPPIGPGPTSQNVKLVSAVVVVQKGFMRARAPFRARVS